MDLLGMLEVVGEERDDYYEDQNGYFSWNVRYEGGFRVLEVVFEEYNETEDSFDHVATHSKKYRLTPVEG